MNNWIVIVKRRGDPNRRRVFVEDIQYEDEAEMLALLKLGANPEEHETSADRVDAKVSMENPGEDIKKMYDKALIDMTEAQRECQDAISLSNANLERAEMLERELLHQSRGRTLAAENLGQIKQMLEKVQQDLESI